MTGFVVAVIQRGLAESRYVYPFKLVCFVIMKASQRR